MLNAHVCSISIKNGAHPNLHIIAGGGGELLVEPRRVVERAAGAGRAAPSAVPQRRLLVKPIVIDVAIDFPLKPRVTEVVLPHECWRVLSSTLCVGTLAAVTFMGSVFVQCRCKGPDVLSRVAAVSQADTVDIYIVNVRA